MKQKRPIIGLTPQIDITNDFRHVRLFPQYQRSIERAGGIGVMLPLTKSKEVMKEMSEAFDGFLFTGGQDINPTMYDEMTDEELSYTTGFAPERDEFESAFYPIVKKTGKPILAICRGFQIINVLHGGSIVQDLPTFSESENFVLHPAWPGVEAENYGLHDINVVPGTKLAEVANRDVFQVNSYHHQGIKTLGEGLSVSGVSPDGLIEAFDIDGLDFGVAVQWHPEVLFDSDITDGRLFKAFVDACKKDMEARSVLDAELP